jgi:S-formylglutathione hydrolase FrmB
MMSESPRPIGRRVLLGAAGLTALAAWTGCASTSAPSPSTPRRHPIVDAPVPSQTATLAPGPIDSGTLTSAATGLDHPWLISYPPGATPGDHLPVAIMLHGYGDTISGMELHHYPEALAQTVAAGGTPFAVAAINGGNLFWQKDGNADAGAMVASEFVPLLKKQGLNTKRLALTGWSMGGWGSLRLACDQLHGKLRAVAAVSTPCYLSLIHI